jgi:hypothetical protein
MTQGPARPEGYDTGQAVDDSLEADGYAAGIDVWDVMSDIYEQSVDDGDVAARQLYSLWQAIRRQHLGELTGDAGAAKAGSAGLTL